MVGEVGSRPPTKLDSVILRPRGSDSNETSPLCSRFSVVLQCCFAGSLSSIPTSRSGCPDSSPRPPPYLVRCVPFLRMAAISQKVSAATKCCLCWRGMFPCKVIRMGNRLSSWCCCGAIWTRRASLLVLARSGRRDPSDELQRGEAAAGHSRISHAGDVRAEDGCRDLRPGPGISLPSTPGFRWRNWKKRCAPASRSVMPILRRKVPAIFSRQTTGASTRRTNPRRVRRIANEPIDALLRDPAAGAHLLGHVPNRPGHGE